MHQLWSLILSETRLETEIDYCQLHLWCQSASCWTRVIDTPFEAVIGWSSSSLQDYLAHIIDQCDVSIRPEHVCALFGNIEDIYEFNRWHNHAQFTELISGTERKVEVLPPAQCSASFSASEFLLKHIKSWFWNPVSLTNMKDLLWHHLLGRWHHYRKKFQGRIKIVFFFFCQFYCWTRSVTRRIPHFSSCGSNLLA